MPTLSFYEYWEDFIEEWYNNGNATPNPTPKGWTNPNDPKYNMSSDYLPEPWWGNDGNKTLHSVVINFNPGEGGKEQEKKNLPYINSYANDIVNPCNVLCKTCQWHWNNRAIPIFQAL